MSDVHLRFFFCFRRGRFFFLHGRALTDGSAYAK